MSRRNKASTHEHIDNHRWVISYADFITLLFAFFVVMYAISSVNISKYKSLSEGMHSAFDKKDRNHAHVSTDNKQDGPSKVAPTNKKGVYGDDLDELNSTLAELKNNTFQMDRREGRINMNITAKSLFENGTAELTSEALVSLMKLAHKLKTVPFPIAIEGYTDNVPIDTPQYKSNWDLSASRAAALGRVLNSYGIASNRISIIGYGDQFPIMDNATELGRSRNRRVNIVVSKTSIVNREPNQAEGPFYGVEPKQ